MCLTTLQLPEFLTLKSQITSYPRSSGYYLIDLVSIEVLTHQPLLEDEKLDLLFQHFDDQEWPPKLERPQDQSWEDYTVERSKARDHLIESLIGGNSIGHMSDTIPTSEANSIYKDFELLFSPPCKYFINMGLGSYDYVFQLGLAIVDNQRAGFIGVIEND